MGNNNIRAGPHLIAMVNKETFAERNCSRTFSCIRVYLTSILLQISTATISVNSVLLIFMHKVNQAIFVMSYEYMMLFF